MDYILIFRAVNHNWLNIKLLSNWRWWIIHLKLKTSCLSFLPRHWYEVRTSNCSDIQIMWKWAWNSGLLPHHHYLFEIAKMSSPSFSIASGRNLLPPRIIPLSRDAGQVREIFLLLMPLSQTAQLYLRQPEMRDDLLHMWKSITLTDTPLILYYPRIEMIAREPFYDFSFNVYLRNIFITICLIMLLITEEGKISSYVFVAYLDSSARGNGVLKTALVMFVRKEWL